MDKPFVTIELQPFLQDYMLHEFPKSPAGDGVMVNSDNDMGILVQTMVTVTDRPPRQETKDFPFRLYLPVQEWNHYIFRENFIYIPEWKQQMLRMYIEASFRLRVREYFVTGYELHHKQDTLIRAFLQAYNIRHNALSYEAVKKYDYRNRKKVLKQVNREIQLSLFE